MMIAINATQSINPNILGVQRSPEVKSQSFHGKSFKALRVTGDALASLVMSIFYKVLSLACWIVFQKSAAHWYGDLASFHFNCILDRPLAYLLYGDKIVNFATNSPGTPVSFNEKKGNEVKELEKLYGKRFNEMRTLASSIDLPIPDKNLSRYPINEGICLGASLDFISRYLKAKTTKPFETIAKISSLFTDRGTPEAQITQILYKAQNTDSLMKKKSAFRDSHKETYMKAAEELRGKINDSQKSKEGMEKLSEAAQIELINKEQKTLLEVQADIKVLQRYIDEAVVENDATLYCEIFQQFAKANGLQLHLDTLFIDKDVKQTTPLESFKTRISTLPEGAYLTCLSSASEEKDGHAIAFIKTAENETFLFDDNFATLRFEKSEEFISELWKLTKKFYNTHGKCTMQIFNCNLIDELKTNVVSFEENVDWMNEIPSAVHYNAFNNGNLSHIAQSARKNMRGLLEMMGAKEFKNSLAAKTLPGWADANALSLPDDKNFSCGQFHLTGQEIKTLASSLRVSYDPSILSCTKLRDILVDGSSSTLEEAQARGRMVSSLVASVCDSRGNPLPREKELPLYRVYTSNAPNLAYSAHDQKEFVQNGALNHEKYTKELERIFLHYFKEAKANQDKVIVLSGFGMGAFMTPELLPDAQKCFVEGLRRAINAEGKHFDKIIFADPNKKLTPAISSIPNIIVTNKSCLDTAHHGSQKGFKIALFNPGDGSGIPGQYWLRGHIALEEMFGLFTTLLVAQHPHCNPKVADSSSYVLTH